MRSGSGLVLACGLRSAASERQDLAGYGWNGEEEHFVTLAEHDSAAPRERGHMSVTGPDVLILVMASHSLQWRAKLVELSRPEVQQLFLVDEWLETVPRKSQWRPERQEHRTTGQGTGVVHESYWDAQTRQLEFMRTQPLGGVRWVLLADDDTWVHVDRLLSFISGRDFERPALFSYVLSDAHVLGYDYPCGGAGMLLSAGAYARLAPRLLSQECPFLHFNDLTLGFCAHALGIPLVHHPNMHCAPDVNRAMRPGENWLDMMQALSVHRLPAFDSFGDVDGTLQALRSQAGSLVLARCQVAAQMDSPGSDSRRFFWPSEAFPALIDACRGHAPEAPRNHSLHFEFVFFGGGAPVARYHNDRGAPFIVMPRKRGARWPEWLEQLSARCGRSSWMARWIGSPPRISRRQFDATRVEDLASSSSLSPEAVRASFADLEGRSPQGPWLQQLRRALGGRDARSARLRERGTGATWYFLAFAPATTFVNTFEAARLLRSLSSLYRSGAGEDAPHGARSVVDLSDGAPPPLALGYEYFDVHVEPDAGIWLNGVAMERLLRCPSMGHPITLSPAAHANDWETPDERAALLWHNALAVDLHRTLRFCGVLVLHTPSMVPHALTYLTYSTYRRPHAPSVAAAVTLGNVASREQMYAMSRLVSRRACRSRRDRCAAWRPPFRMHIREYSDAGERWSLPGARLVGNYLMAYRSEHFLADAQAVSD